MRTTSLNNNIAMLLCRQKSCQIYAPNLGAYIYHGFAAEANSFKFCAPHCGANIYHQCAYTPTIITYVCTTLCCVRISLFAVVHKYIISLRPTYNQHMFMHHNFVHKSVMIWSPNPNDAIFPDKGFVHKSIMHLLPKHNVV